MSFDEIKLIQSCLATVRCNAIRHSCSIIRTVAIQQCKIHFVQEQKVQMQWERYVEQATLRSRVNICTRSSSPLSTNRRTPTTFNIYIYSFT